MMMSPTACARSNERREAIALSMFPDETRARHIRRCSFTAKSGICLPVARRIVHGLRIGKT